MIVPDLFNRTYIAEILRTQLDTDFIIETIKRLTIEHSPPEQVEELGATSITMIHSFLPSSTGYHRFTRTVESPMQGTFSVPRTKNIRGKQHYLYDVLIATGGRDVIIAVPYHALAEMFFVQVNRALAGKRAMYEKLDITNLVVKLGQSGSVQILSDGKPRKLEIGLTRCQLAYSDPQSRSQSLQQVLISGGHIGASDVYRYLVKPVLDPKNYPLTVTPILIGFALFADGIKKTSAATDRHGNFKLWIGPGATRIERLFTLLKGIESIKGILSTTGNLPILQSRAIKGAEGE